MEEQFTFFWKSPLSQWQRSPFVLGGVPFTHAEQCTPKHCSAAIAKLRHHRQFDHNASYTMTIDEARIKVQEHWKTIAENRLGYEIVIDDNLTREYPWGWHFVFVPVDPRLVRLANEYAFDRITGESVPVGTKGLGNALDYLMHWREQLGVKEG